MEGYDNWKLSKIYNDMDYSKEGYSELDIRKIFFIEDFLSIVNYGDESISVKLADEIIEFLKAVLNGSQHELFAKDSIKYILYFNILSDWLDYGTSFCGCWFSGKHKCYDGNEKEIVIDKEFVKELLEFLRGSE